MADPEHGALPVLGQPEPPPDPTAAASPRSGTTGGMEMTPEQARQFFNSLDPQVLMQLGAALTAAASWPKSTSAVTPEPGARAGQQQLMQEKDAEEADASRREEDAAGANELQHGLARATTVGWAEDEAAELAELDRQTAERAQHEEHAWRRRQALLRQRQERE